MDKIHLRLCFRQVISFFLLCFLFTLLISTPVRADVGIQPILPGGSNIKPGEETPIQMAAEVVVMNVRQATEADNASIKLNPKWYGYDQRDVWFTCIAEVEADFTMKNPTSDTLSMTVWFPLASALENVNWRTNLPGEIVPRIESFKVSVDGNPVDFTASELPNPKGFEYTPLPWASFKVTFPGNKDTLIHVSYLVPLQPSAKGFTMALYYIFQTGAGWAGPIGKAELILNLPYPASMETLAGMSNSLRLPPMYLPKAGKLPFGMTMEGNQARLTWKGFEPGPEDDFAIWLLQPDKWQEIAAARAAVQANPQDGKAWLQLAFVYHSLSLTRTNTRMVFSDQFLDPCIQAYRKAAILLPDHPVPHAALGLFALEPHLAKQNAPADVLQYVQNELQVARDLEARDPSLTEGAIITSEGLANALNYYLYNSATEIAYLGTVAAYKVTETVRATLEYATRTVWAIDHATYLAVWATNMNCWATAGADCTATPIPTLTPTQTLMPKPTRTPTLLPSRVPTPTVITAKTAGNETNQIIITAAGVLALLLAGFAASKRLR